MFASRVCSRRRMLGAALLAAGLLSPVAWGESPEAEGLRIAKLVDDASSGYQGEEAQLTLALVNAHGDRIERKMAARIKEFADDGDRSLITFSWPADVKGTRLLTWTHKTNDDDQWLYLPEGNRVRRIASGNKSGSFMGSEFA